MASPHRIALITTGGTITGHISSDKQDPGMIRTGDELMALLARMIDFLDRLHGIEISIDPFEVCNEDSSNILPKHWAQLAELIKQKYDDYDSFIITHGTNTLGYTCAALSFSLANPNKPIVLTGAQVTAGLPGSDGFINLENALRIAVWRREMNPIKGVVAVFGSHIIAGTRVKKDTEFDYDGFKSFGSGSIGRIGRIININESNLLRHVRYLHSASYPMATKAKELLCEHDFDMRIASITEFPGMSSDLFKSVVEQNEIKGIILRSFGAGDPCMSHRAAFEYLKSEKIPLVVTTQVPNGNSNFQVNESGRILRENQLAIPAYDMSIESQTTKLGWLLAKMNRGEISDARLGQDMITDMRGEINPIWEVDA